MASITQCRINNCKRKGRIGADGKRHFIKGLCNMHYKRNRNGTDMHKEVSYGFEKRMSIVVDNIAKIPIGVNAKHGFAIVDCDMAWLDKYKWTLSRGYASANIGNRNVQMHRLILGVSSTIHVDHMDRSRLNNTKANLRIASPAQNRWNTGPNAGTSVYKGVSMRSNGKWRARITYRGERKELGTFDYEDEAAKAYDKAAKYYFGEYAYLNFGTP